MVSDTMSNTVVVGWSTVDRPIGMFDSGFGGLTVARAVIDLLPAEDLVYIGDTGRYPYGPKPQAEVREFARQLAWSLVKELRREGDRRGLQHRRGRRRSTSSRAELPVPVIDVIEPGARALVQATRERAGRRDRHRRHHRLGRLRAGGRRRPAPTSTLTVRGLPRLRRVRRARPDDAATRSRSSPSDCSPRCSDADVDALLLGCTHYPYLARVDRRRDGPRRDAGVSSADETAFAAARPARRSSACCATRDRRRPARTGSCPSGDIAWFADLGGRLLGPELDARRAPGPDDRRHASATDVLDDPSPPSTGDPP